MTTSLTEVLIRIIGNPDECLYSENIYKFYTQDCNKEYMVKQQCDFKSDLEPSKKCLCFLMVQRTFENLKLRKRK